MGAPIHARCTRIWCERPVRGVTARSAVPSGPPPRRRYSVSDALPRSRLTLYWLRRSTRRAMAASIRPSGRAGAGWTSARYVFRMPPRRNSSYTAFSVGSFLANSSTPEVGWSRRWSTAGRCAAPARARCSATPSWTLPSWPVADSATGVPDGLSTTSRSSSSNRMADGSRRKVRNGWSGSTHTLRRPPAGAGEAATWRRRPSR